MSKDKYADLRIAIRRVKRGSWQAQRSSTGGQGFEVANAASHEQICTTPTKPRALYIAAANPVAIANLLAERDALREALKSAAARIEDMLMDDDGQAWKEARKAVPAIREALKKGEVS